MSRFHRGANFGQGCLFDLTEGQIVAKFAHVLTRLEGQVGNRKGLADELAVSPVTVAHWFNPNADKTIPALKLLTLIARHPDACDELVDFICSLAGGWFVRASQAGPASAESMARVDQHLALAKSYLATMPFDPGAGSDAARELDATVRRLLGLLRGLNGGDAT